jgi:hemerythrin-like metal-binding protein
MALFTWDNIYSVGVTSIDNQHRRLFDIANRFHAAYINRDGRPVLTAIFKELVNYTATHFADEEQLMREHNFPDYPEHKAQHDKLVRLVLVYQEQFERGDADIEQRAMNFIKTWLNGHILGTDRNYRPYMAQGQHAPALTHV